MGRSSRVLVAMASTVGVGLLAGCHEVFPYAATLADSAAADAHTERPTAADGVPGQEGLTLATDANASCEPGITEICYTGPADTLGVGPCKEGHRRCLAAGTWGPCTGQVTPVPETCNDRDDDCNGETDEDPSCCVPDCFDKPCGADDGCGTPCPFGSCPVSGQRCVEGSCCSPNCPASKWCGDSDDCGDGGQCDGLCASSFESCQPTGGGAQLPMYECVCQPAATKLSGACCCEYRRCGIDPDLECLDLSCGTCIPPLECDDIQGACVYP